MRNSVPLAAAPDAVIYRGDRTRRGARVRVSVNGGRTWRRLNPRLDIMNKSPTGLEWGYGGSGPGQLAIALLAHALEDRQRALRLFQRFKWARIASLPREGFVITKEEVVATAVFIELSLPGRTLESSNA